MMKRRLKIAEQILIVLLLALVLPLVVAAAIIINTNQIAVRKELTSSARIIAHSLADELITLKQFEKNNLFYSAEALKKIPNNERDEFLKILKSANENIEDVSFVKLPANFTILNKYSIAYFPEDKTTHFSFVDNSNNLITKKVSINYIDEHIFDNFELEKRQIYIFDAQKQLILAKNYEEKRWKDILETFPDTASIGNEPVVFSKYKNQPNVLLYSPDFKFYIVVSSPKNLTYYGIVEAKRKIIFAIAIAAITVFVLFAIYTFSLYTNIRQIFKIIQSISAGNYNRKIRVITNPLTSQEIIFVADEFNKMIEKIDESYQKLHESNKKLKKMDEYKSNLIDTVSHEFRTPLTSIKGYASSLLRYDSQLDVEARKKSLKIIKHQTERLSRMVEDLLVIPDIESATLRMNYKEVSLKDVIDVSILSTTKTEDLQLNLDIDVPDTIYADEDRLVQILINLLENAIKYSKENTPISISAKQNDEFAIVKIHNEADFIDEASLNGLFDKFSRLESDLTRTTRGTGLGLFIVKGLVETMSGEISLSSNDGFEVTFTIPLYKGQDNVE